MPDREKTIRGLYQHCKGSMFDRCGECPYYDVEDHEPFQCRDELLHDALKLLKEQEAKPMTEYDDGWDCPRCGLKLVGKTASGYPCDELDLPNDEIVKYCPVCGQAVKWE